MSKSTENEPTERTPLGTAVLSLTPLLFTGPISVIISYHPWWDPEQFPWVSTLYPVFVSLMICCVFVLGIRMKFPRWSYPYAVYLLFLITGLITYPVYQVLWYASCIEGILYLVAAALILATFRIRAFKPFYANIRRDWTFLSYGLYACTLMLLATTDHDEAPQLNFWVMLPTLIGILGAFLHLRATSTRQRIAVLLACMLVGVFIALLPVFDGMVRSFAGYAVSLGLLIGFWGMMAGLLLAPTQINRLMPPRRAS